MDVTGGTIRRAMLYLGYESHGKTLAQEWRKPTPIVIEETPRTNVTEIYPATETTTTIDVAPAENVTEILPTPEEEIPTPEEEIPPTTSEEIPTSPDPISGSWAIDPDQLPDGMTLMELRLVWAASGLDVEIRVRPRGSAQTREDAI